MDEYLFIEFAKLQADRRRLEREQREESRRLNPEERRSNEGHREPLRQQWFANSWSKQS
jgi:hypothetical protein